MIEIVTMVLGPVETNTYILAEPVSKQAVVVDPAWNGKAIAQAVSQRGWTIKQVWLTHAHFDHFAGTAALVGQVSPEPPVAMHPADLPLWSMKGGAAMFGFQVDDCPRPTIALEPGLDLEVGGVHFEVRHAPGHSPGHVVFYSGKEGVVFCGDVIFANSIGRTDLPGGDYSQLLQSIQTQILSLPDATRLLSGHGVETTVGQERRFNPFLTDLLIQ